jgi:S1-C subfamily serine protease
MRTELRITASTCAIAFFGGLWMAAPVAAQAQSGGAVVRAAGQPDSARITIATTPDVILLLDNVRKLRLISQEFGRIAMMVAADTLSRGGFFAGSAEVRVRAFVPAVRSLQQHATEALWFIERECIRTPSLGRAYLGVELDVVMRTDSTELVPISEIPYPRVVRVERESPAERAGFLPGDRIIRMNGVDVRDRDMSQFITRPGATLEVRIRRDGSERSVKAELAAPPPSELAVGAGFSHACRSFVNPAEFTVLFQRDSITSQVLKIPSLQAPKTVMMVSVRRGASPDSSGATAVTTGRVTFSGSTAATASGAATTAVDFWGARFRSASPVYLQNEGATEGGVPVMFIAANSVAARAGLEIGDIVVRTGGKQVTSITDFLAAVNSGTSRREASIELEVLRDRASRRITIPLR